MSGQVRGELIQAKNLLLRRRAATADANEQAVIDDALAELNDTIDAITQASLLEAAGLVAAATDALERVVASARLGPFDGFLGGAEQAIDRLQAELDSMQSSERLPPAPEPEVAPAAGGAGEQVAPQRAEAGPEHHTSEGTPQPIDSRSFEALRAEYGEFYDRCHLRREFAPNVEFYVSRLVKFRPTYQQLGEGLGIPWVFIGVVHGMECGFNFSTHLHNGDPLAARTVHVPAGRPAAGQPPFTWAESARDALLLRKLDQVGDWSLPRLLYELEAYNGFGYRRRRVPTPYLWSFSNLYGAGKFVRDGVFDPAAVSKQCGAAVMLRVLQERAAL